MKKVRFNDIITIHEVGNESRAGHWVLDAIRERRDKLKINYKELKIRKEKNQEEDDDFIIEFRQISISS
ncbi:hypothetical protein PmNV_057 [Penaeus monodon nudivirus]|uniref:Uncharacterized protein n=1 Tax=Penaeus monodon nudivirus TaxID=1529056 RepID=A0A076FDZ5_9VIRU|nr:hypothetical protein PmNV_057 [Penaeus monodon nudivirus]AII15845.1 hypothetical protein PmNV_057 [Penaeus monodon nudivirus]